VVLSGTLLCCAVCQDFSCPITGMLDET